MKTITLVDAKTKLDGLSDLDVRLVYIKASGQKPPRGATRETVLDAVLDAAKEKLEGEGEAAVLNPEATGWFDGVGDAKAPKPLKEANVAVELGKLVKLPTGALREKYEQLFGKPVKTGNRQFLLKKIAWKMQANEQGGLSEKAVARAEEIVEVGGIGTKLAKKLKDARPRDPRLPATGSIITKVWRDKTLQVLVGENDFEFEGTKWRSLSAISSKLLGVPSNGFLFWNLLPKQKEAAEKREAKQAAKAEAAVTDAPAADATPIEAPKREPKKKAKKAAKPSKKGAK